MDSIALSLSLCSWFGSFFLRYSVYTRLLEYCLSIDSVSGKFLAEKTEDHGYPLRILYTIADYFITYGVHTIRSWPCLWRAGSLGLPHPPMTGMAKAVDGALWPFDPFSQTCVRLRWKSQLLVLVR